MSGISITIIGGGKMGEAILKGWLASTYVPAARIEPADVVVVEPGEERRAFLSAEHGVTCVADASLIEPGQTDVVVLSVKPQVMMNVLETVSANPAFSGGADGPLFISIAAGIPTTRLEAALPQDAPLSNEHRRRAQYRPLAQVVALEGAGLQDRHLLWLRGSIHGRHLDMDGAPAGRAYMCLSP